MVLHDFILFILGFGLGIIALTYICRKDSFVRFLVNGDDNSPILNFVTKYATKYALKYFMNGGLK